MIQTLNILIKHTHKTSSPLLRDNTLISLLTIKMFYHYLYKVYLPQCWPRSWTNM